MKHKKAQPSPNFYFTICQNITFHSKVLARTRKADTHTDTKTLTPLRPTVWVCGLKKNIPRDLYDRILLLQDWQITSYLFSNVLGEVFKKLNFPSNHFNYISDNLCDGTTVVLEVCRSGARIILGFWGCAPMAHSPQICAPFSRDVRHIYTYNTVYI